MTDAVVSTSRISATRPLYFQLFQLSPPVPPLRRPPPPAAVAVYRFAGRTVTSGSLVLITVVTKEDGAAQLTVNCEKMLIGTMLVKDVLLALTQ